MLEAAYDDAPGVTAEFNRNVLRVLNRELDADFDPEDFDHVALFDREHEWIEMRLRARREHTTIVRDLDLPVHFDAGEELRTEISAKFTPERLEGDLAAAGLELVRWLTDPEELFALTLSRAPSTQAARRIGSARWRSRAAAALVVGGASGLGEATVRALHARGAVVTIADVNAEKGQALARRARADFVACDVREEDQVEAAVEQAAAGERRAAHRDLLRGHRLGAEGRGLEGPAPAAALRDDHLDQPDRHLQRAALRGRGDDRQRAARGRRTRRLRQHRLDRRLRRPGRPDRLLRIQGRRRRHDAARRARPLAVRHPRQHDRARACSTRRCSRRCPRRRARRSARASPSRSASARPPSTRSWPARSSRTACSTARRSGSTARCACRRARRESGMGRARPDPRRLLRCLRARAAPHAVHRGARSAIREHACAESTSSAAWTPIACRTISACATGSARSPRASPGAVRPRGSRPRLRSAPSARDAGSWRSLAARRACNSLPQRRRGQIAGRSRAQRAGEVPPADRDPLQATAQAGR